MNTVLNPVIYEQVVTLLDENTSVLPGETVTVKDALGRVLAAGVVVGTNHPPTPVVAVDGYALQASATVGASEYNALPFKITSSDDDNRTAHNAVPVASGDPLPDGTDTVTALPDTVVREQFLEVFSPLAPGENVIPAGGELQDNDDSTFPKGRRLRPQDIALLGKAGIDSISVVRRPVVACFMVRDNIPDICGPMVQALVEQDGGVNIELQRATAALTLAQALARRQADLVLVVGGSGLGPNDHAISALAESGEVLIRGVAISPGESATIGRIENTMVIVLPGPPLAALFAYDALAGRVVRVLGGRGSDWPYGKRSVTLVRKIASGLGRFEYCRVRVTGDRAEPVAISEHRILATTVRADGFVLIPTQSEGYAEGTEVEAYLYAQRF